ncbi:hypothetical protein T5B8_13233 [Salinisphaera sp. T5B8]
MLIAFALFMKVVFAFVMIRREIKHLSHMALVHLLMNRIWHRALPHHRHYLSNLFGLIPLQLLYS